MYGNGTFTYPIGSLSGIAAAESVLLGQQHNYACANVRTYVHIYSPRNR